MNNDAPTLYEVPGFSPMPRTGGLLFQTNLRLETWPSFINVVCLPDPLEDCTCLIPLPFLRNVPGQTIVRGIRTVFGRFSDPGVAADAYDNAIFHIFGFKSKNVLNFSGPYSSRRYPPPPPTLLTRAIAQALGNPLPATSDQQ